MSVDVTLRQLLESGVHFGRQTRRWNPKMKRYIFTERNDIYIIDLQQSLDYIDRAYEFIKETVAHGGTILYVGTKKQAQEAIAEQARRVGMPFVNQRWLGGMLTNFSSVYKRLQRLKELEEFDFNDMAGSGTTKKELLHLRREHDKLDRTLGGIRDMARVPSAIWVVDTKKEHIAVNEARELGIPVVAILDTNCDPDEINYPIPGNDDTIRSVTLLTRVVTDAVAEGLLARADRAVGTPDIKADHQFGREEPLAEWERDLLGIQGDVDGEVLAVQAFAQWLLRHLTNESRKQWDSFELDRQQEQALKRIVNNSVERIFRELTLGGAEPAQLKNIFGQVSNYPVLDSDAAGNRTFSELLRVAIAAALAPLDEVDIGRHGRTPEPVRHSVAELATSLADNILGEIVVNGATGGPLISLADQLRHEVISLHSQRVPTVFQAGRDVRIGFRRNPAVKDVDLVRDADWLNKAESDLSVAFLPGSRELSTDYMDTLAAANNFAVSLQAAGYIERAIELFQKIYARRLEIFDADHPSVLIILNNLAAAYQASGQIAEPVRLYERVLAGRERVLGADHPDTLLSRSNLAGAYRSAGRLGEAIALYERVLAGRERVLGADHPDTLLSRSNLAGAYRSAGRLGEAIALYERVLAGRERVLGADHPDTLVSRSNLAGAFEAAGRLGEAIALYERVLAGRERVLGADHPDTLVSRSNLAGAYRSAGRLGEAIALYEQALADSERVLGVHHRDTLVSRSNLAYGFEAAGRLGEAIALYEQALADSERVLGADHPDTLVSRSNLAGAFEAAGRLGEAIALYEQALADSERVLGADHPDTLVSRSNLAGAFEAAGRLGEAIALYEQALAGRERVLGSDHPDTRRVRNAVSLLRRQRNVAFYTSSQRDARKLEPDLPRTAEPAEAKQDTSSTGSEANG